MAIDDDEASAIAKHVLAEAQAQSQEIDSIAIIRGGEVRVWAGPPIMDLLAS